MGETQIFWKKLGVLCVLSLIYVYSLLLPLPLPYTVYCTLSTVSVNQQETGDLQETDTWGGGGYRIEDRYLGCDKMHYQNFVWRMAGFCPDVNVAEVSSGWSTAFCRTQGSNLYFKRYPNLKRAKNARDGPSRFAESRLFT